MVRQELLKRYAGTLGGTLWALLNPLATILVFWLVFSKGLKVAPDGGIPYILYFIGGFVPWLAFSESISASCASIIANEHLVKKIAFPTETLPLVYLATSLVVHLFLIAVIFALILAHGMTPHVSAFAVIYYAAGLLTLSLGMGWLLSALNVFFRDTQQILGVLLNIWFWLTPIVWPADLMPKAFQALLTLNPLYFVVDGYRRALIYGEMVNPDLLAHAIFWLTAVLIFILGATVFRRLKPEFAEVL